jgi:uncharacterized protein YceH (UPF0502 family)
MQLDENTVRDALSGLQEQRLAGTAGGADSRVTKYEHRAQEVFNFTRGESAILCVLLLRGPQTPGELRSRSERIHRFAHLDEVSSALQRLIQRDPPLARILPRQPGTKESRYMHLLSGDIEDGGDASGMERSPSPLTAGSSVEAARVTRLEQEVVDLRREVADLKQEMERFRKQFE